MPAVTTFDDRLPWLVAGHTTPHNHGTTNRTGHLLRRGGVCGGTRAGLLAVVSSALRATSADALGSFLRLIDCKGSAMLDHPAAGRIGRHSGHHSLVGRRQPALRLRHALVRD